MNIAPLTFAITLMLIGVGAMIGFRVLTVQAQKKRITPFGIRKDELDGEKRHCDGYSAGTFTW